MRRLMVPLVVLLLASAACSGGDDDDVSASKGTTSTSVALAGDAGGAEATSTAPPGGATGGTTAKGTGAAGATAASPVPTAAPPPAPPNATFTAPGKYTFVTNGKRGGQDVKDARSELTMDPPNGADQRGVQRGQNGTTEQVIRRQTDGTYFVYFGITAGFIKKEFRPNPPVLVLPTPATVGRTWSWEMKSSDGATTVRSSFKIVRNEVVDVGGEKVETIVLEADVVTSGDFNQRTQSTIWTSPRYSLIVQTTDTTTGGPFAGTSTSKLQSTRPA